MVGSVSWGLNFGDLPPERGSDPGEHFGCRVAQAPLYAREVSGGEVSGGRETAQPVAALLA
jgi:hypothetical protein